MFVFLFLLLFYLYSQGFLSRLSPADIQSLIIFDNPLLALASSLLLTSCIPHQFFLRDVMGLLY